MCTFFDALFAAKVVHTTMARLLRNGVQNLTQTTRQNLHTLQGIAKPIEHFMRWMSIDYGSARIGVAIGNDADGIASPIEVISAQPAERAIERIRELVAEYGVEGIVVGWPLNMDDSEGPQAQASRAVALVLAEKTHLEVRMWDERLSSFAADEKLKGLFTRKKKKARQDAVAAAAILHDFFIAGAGESNAPRPNERQ